MPSQRIRPKKILPLIFTTAFLSIFVTASCSNSQTLRCTRVIDGDTIVVNNGETVRLIGVDTPETKHPRKPVEYFGNKAYVFTKRMVEGKAVRLEYDQQKRDKYGRLLAYVYLSTLVHKYGNVFSIYAESRYESTSLLFILHIRRLRSLRVNFHSKGFAISW